MNNQPVRITSIMWSAYVPSFLSAAEGSPNVELEIFSQKEIEKDIDSLEIFWASAQKADVILLYWTADGLWEDVSNRIGELTGDKIVVTTSFDPSNWGRGATVDVSVCARAYAYIAEGGTENHTRLLEFMAHQVNPEIAVLEPVSLPWQGIHHPPDPAVYDTVDDYRNIYPAIHQHTVGIFFSRHTFTNTDGSLEQDIIKALEARGVNVLPVFSHGVPDRESGALGPVETARRFFIGRDGRPLIHAMINLHFFFLGRETDKAQGADIAGQTISLFKGLNVPVFKPVIAYSKSVQEWEEDPQGLTAEVSFGIAMPEFEGNIEPILMACSSKMTDEHSGTAYEIREGIKERVEHIADRVSRWVRVSTKPTSERKVVFVLHKNECAGLEANVGGAAGLDTGESIVQIMEEMAKEGYRINDIPSSGEALMQKIIERKAIAEFRWTTVEEIVAHGGHLALLDNKVYQKWFDELPGKARERLIESWGKPPGHEMNGVPPSMVMDGKLVITGLNFGNVNVIMQPKRGCAGPRCDGRVCKILHDPDLPPPHQYLATYMYMDRNFGADVIIHVGTHGNIEWLPGKGAGLSSACWPDIAIGNVPHLYIYNSDNPAEGVVAKRRSYATLVDHMQAVMSTADTYGEMQELENLLNDYNRAGEADRARAHQLEHLINEAIDRNHMRNHINSLECQNFNDVVKGCHELLSGVRNSQTKIGMHIMGRQLQKHERAEVINTILRFDSSSELNSRCLVFDLWGEDIFLALKEPGFTGECGKVYGEMLYEADCLAVEFIERIMEGEDLLAVLEDYNEVPMEYKLKELFKNFGRLVKDINGRIEGSKEIGVLLKGMDGGHVPAGPSGYISRGRYDILPTGRNFYNVDPTRIPTPAACRVGIGLAEAILNRYLKEEGRYPESIGMVWLASDIMRADGEQVGQIFHLLGVRPKWKANGQINGFKIVPAEELRRPRIDVNIRVSGITRDCFPDTVTYVDKVIQAVGLLEEDPRFNFVRKHILEQAAEQGDSINDKDQFRRLSFRIFCARPGTYKAGVNLAVQASAWKTEAELSDIYMFWNGYAYGGGAGDDTYGVQAHRELLNNLGRIEAIFDKHVSDEGDFLNCCGYYGNYGGMTVAAGSISGKIPKTYYGDTRDPANVAVIDFADEMRRVVRTHLLHPKYIEWMKNHGYKGAGDLNKRIGRVYGFGATTGKVDDWIFDEIAETFVLNTEMKEWFEEVNPWALEEIGRRLLEAEARGVWKPGPGIIDRLKEAYLDTEGRLEDTMGDVKGGFQGGAVDVITADEVEGWKAAMKSIKDRS